MRNLEIPSSKIFRKVVHDKFRNVAKVLWNLYKSIFKKVLISNI